MDGKTAGAAGAIPPGMVDRASESNSIASMLAAIVHQRQLIASLAMRDLKLKYRGSVLGFLWSLATPLLMTGVYTFAFTVVLRVRMEGFVFYLLTGLLAWNFFSNTANMATESIVGAGGLMKSVKLQSVILPVAVVAFNLAQYLLTVAVFLPLMMVVYRVAPSPLLLLFPVFLCLQVLFTVGVALALAAGTVFLRDIKHLLEIALSALFWLTPIIYSLDQIPENARSLILFSPVAPFIVAYQQIFFYGVWPEPRVWALAVGYSLASFLIGASIFVSVEHRFPEMI